MYKYRLNLVTAPTLEPVTLNDVKNHLKITDCGDDDIIRNLISVARTAAESYTRRAFITQTWQMFLDHLPSEKNSKWFDGVRQLPISEIVEKKTLELPKTPLQSVTHIKTYDDSDTATTFSSSNYYVSAYSGEFAEPGKITLRDGQSWPTYERNADGIEIQFVCGYGATLNSVPWQIRQAVIQEVAFMYDHSSDCGEGMNCNIAKKMLDQFRVKRL